MMQENPVKTRLIQSSHPCHTVLKRLTASAVRRFVPARSSTSRKGQNGTVLIVGGSHTYHGAPILASLASLRSGADLVYTAVPKINVAPTRATSPDLIVIPLADQKITRGAVNKLVGALPLGLDSAAIGMGLAVHDRNALIHLVKSLLDRDVRLSLDAGALLPEVLPALAGHNVVVTPHAGEFGRLFGQAAPESGDGRVILAEEMAKRHGVTVLLKGPTDIISDGTTTYLHSKRTPAMTVGGTGDVLSGLVAGILARNRSPLESASAAVFINGLAGADVQQNLGLHMAATDLLDAIPRVMRPFDRMG